MGIRCRKVCWGLGEGRRDVGRGIRGGVGKCVGVWGRKGEMQGRCK